MNMSSRLLKIIFVSYPNPGELLAAGIVFPVLGILTVVLRFYVRLNRKQKIGPDDWLILPALLMVIGMGAILMAGVRKHVFGYPTPAPKPGQNSLTFHNPELSLLQQLESSITLCLVLAYGFIKLSIVFFYRRLFVVKRKGGILNILSWALIGIIIAWMVCFVFITIFGCGTHFAAKWGSPLDLITYCGEGLKREEGLYVSEFVTNILLVALPLPKIWRLNMQWGKKLAVTGILLLAFMALIASIIRLVIVLQVTSASYSIKTDIDLTISTIFYWGMIEAGLALIACSLPSLKPLISEAGLQSAINSVRSAISLNSIAGNGSSGSKDLKVSKTKTNTYGKLEDGAQDSAPLRGDGIVEMNATASHAVPPKRAMFYERIRVQKDVDVVGSRA